jgi:hypothetical protein
MQWPRPTKKENMSSVEGICGHFIAYLAMERETREVRLQKMLPDNCHPPGKLLMVWIHATYLFFKQRGKLCFILFVLLDARKADSSHP